MAESEETDLGHHISHEDSDSDSSFEVIEDPENPRVSTMILFLGSASSAQHHKLIIFVFRGHNSCHNIANDTVFRLPQHRG